MLTISSSKGGMSVCGDVWNALEGQIRWRTMSSQLCAACLAFARSSSRASFATSHSEHSGPPEYRVRRGTRSCVNSRNAGLIPAIGVPLPALLMASSVERSGKPAAHFNIHPFPSHALPSGSPPPRLAPAFSCEKEAFIQTAQQYSTHIRFLRPALQAPTRKDGAARARMTSFATSCR